MGAWNGLALVTEFSETLGDTSTGFKARVTKWCNDIIDDISSRHQWPHLHKYGQKLLVSGTEFQNLNASAPIAAVIAASNGGALTTGSTYSIKVTYVQSSNGFETDSGAVSNTATVSGSSLMLSVTGLPVSGEALVTSRKIYLSKDSGTYYYSSEITNNTATTASVSADVSSTIEPPDYVGIKMLVGNPWISASGVFLDYRDEDTIRMMFPTTLTIGIPEFFASIDYNRIMTYPAATTSVSIKFNYIKIPSRMFNDATVQPDLPIWMKNILEAGVLAKGYQYRERSVAVTYKQMYEKMLADAISERSKSRHGAARIRDVTGNVDGYIF